jgi:hypothetical protein
LLFLLPILFLGKVVYPRYLLPVLPFLIISFCLSLSLVTSHFKKSIVAILLSLIFLIGSYWTYSSLTAPEKMPLTHNEQIQLLGEWSAGYGIIHTVALIEELSKEVPTLVLTEGHIGTLPDGLQIYFYNRPTRNNIRIEGVGQPIKDENLLEKQAIIDDYQQVLLVVNSNRLELSESWQKTLLAYFRRPVSNAPSLQVWRLL